MHDLPLMGFGTFIGLEVDAIVDPGVRHRTTVNVIVDALTMGYRHLDLAENYGNLSAVAEALVIAFRDCDQGGLGLIRDELWLTMKASAPFTHEHIDALLHDVGVESFDLFLIHKPNVPDIFQSEHSLISAWRDLAAISEEKLARIGVSNFYEPHLERLLAICVNEQLKMPYANEIEINALSKNQQLVQYCQDHELKVIAYSPLGYAYVNAVLENLSIQQLAKTMQMTPAQASLAWCMSKGIAVIPKSKQLLHIHENFQAQNYLPLSLESTALMTKIDDEPDIMEGLTLTSVEAKENGAQLTWDVAILPRCSI